MAKFKTLASDLWVVQKQITSPSPRYKGEIMTTITLYNIRTSMTKKVFIVHSFRNCKKWTTILNDPENSFVITNLKDKDLDNIDADSDVRIEECITRADAEEIVQVTAKQNQQQQEEIKPKKKLTPESQFEKLFVFK